MNIIMIYGKSPGLSEIAPKVVRTPRYATGATFWKACKRSLKASEFNQLLDKGYCFHKFPNQRNLMFAVRMQELARLLQVNLDAIDLAEKKIVSIFDFEVLGTDVAIAQQRVDLPLAKYSADAKMQLLQADMSKVDFTSQRWHEAGHVAFWVGNGYRKQDKSGYDGLAQIMVSTAVRIVKGLGVNRLELHDIGEPFTKQGDKLKRHYMESFGAQDHPDSFEDLVIYV